MRRAEAMKANTPLEPIWKDIVSGKARISFDFLAARILQTALVRNFQQAPTTMRLDRCAHELRELFLQNLNQPNARKDLLRVLGGDTSR